LYLLQSFRRYLRWPHQRLTCHPVWLAVSIQIKIECCAAAFYQRIVLLESFYEIFIMFQVFLPIDCDFPGVTFHRKIMSIEVDVIATFIEWLRFVTEVSKLPQGKVRLKSILHNTSKKWSKSFKYKRKFLTGSHAMWRICLKTIGGRPWARYKRASCLIELVGTI